MRHTRAITAADYIDPSPIDAETQRRDSGAFEVEAPNAKSRRAMQELAAGKGKRSASAAAVFQDLGI
ncbi:MAG TPA: hypothetical protein VGG99_29775 [Acetobacteraceae bacterium]|jgi:hypothetical protein